jgi:hypothetical protein
VFIVTHQRHFQSLRLLASESSSCEFSRRFPQECVRLALLLQLHLCFTLRRNASF